MAQYICNLFAIGSAKNRVKGENVKANVVTLTKKAW